MISFGTASAGHQKVVGGVVINLGVVPAEKLKQFPSESGHDNRYPGGSQHLLISLSDGKSGAHFETAKVSVRVTDPKGGVQARISSSDVRQAFLITARFSCSAGPANRIRVTVHLGERKPIRADLVWSHEV